MLVYSITKISDTVERLQYDPSPYYREEATCEIKRRQQVKRRFEKADKAKGSNEENDIKSADEDLYL